MSAPSELDTIVAPATPPGVAGLAVVRLSGSAAVSIAEGLLGSAELTEHPRRLMYGALTHDHEVLDRCLAVLMPGPHSYTGEDVVEFQLHGNPLIVQQVVAACQAAGARLAEPGEFTRRAYLNNRLDLAQAEAVGELIHARSQEALKLASQHLGGEWSKLVQASLEELLAVGAQLTAWLDFSEEDIGELDTENLIRQLDELMARLEAWLTGAGAAQIIRDGYKIALVGLPNAGKSSLLNALAGFEKAIVTNVAGTTRDSIEHALHVDGHLIELIDTAGLRQTDEQVESIGIARARQVIEQAHAIMVLADTPAALSGVLKELQGTSLPPVVIGVQTKLDQNPEPLYWAELAPAEVVQTSATTGIGVEQLRHLCGELAAKATRSESVSTASTRQAAALKTARDELVAARSLLASDQPLDIVAVHTMAAAEALGSITGAAVQESLLAALFSSFCIGK